mgnify:CR=1 FL=1
MAFLIFKMIEETEYMILNKQALVTLGGCEMVFPFNDPFWCDCVRYLHTYGSGDDTVVAPSEFSEALPMSTAA